jgi:hypothetical protein
VIGLVFGMGAAGIVSNGRSVGTRHKFQVEKIKADLDEEVVKGFCTQNGNTFF